MDLAVAQGGLTVSGSHARRLLMQRDVLPVALGAGGACFLLVVLLAVSVMCIWKSRRAVHDRSTWTYNTLFQVGGAGSIHLPFPIFMIGIQSRKGWDTLWYVIHSAFDSFSVKTQYS